MYQREAMWMSFSVPSNSYRSYFAVKISVGGVNALTGLSQKENAIGKQDYLAVSWEQNSAGQRNGQL